MRRLILAALAVATAATPLATPAVAQSRADEARMDAAQARFDREYSVYQQEVARYRASRGGPVYRDQGYPAPYPNGGGYDDRVTYSDDQYDPNYDASRYYRQGNYAPRTLASNDRVYRGSDGRYYCRRSDGTTGLILGAAGGGVLGNVIDGGHSRTAGTLLGAAVGALAGRAVERSQSIQCQ